jgi:hypothetical protein
MARFSGSVTQSGADTTTTLAIDTDILLDGKTGWMIKALRVFWANAEAAAAADWEVTGAITTTTVAPVFTSSDEIARIEWGLQNTAGVAVAVPYEPVKLIELIEPRVTVQPTIYFQAVSTLTGQANTLQFHLFYDVVKLTDIEVLRLLAGGA